MQLSRELRALPVTVAALMAAACASGPPTGFPLGARVDPVKVGILASTIPENGRALYTWQLYDTDGASYTWRWRPSVDADRKALERFQSCLPNPDQLFRPAGVTWLPSIRRCAASCGMEGLAESRGPDASEYRVAIVTGDAANYRASGAVSLAPSLGAQRIVASNPPVPKATVVRDVRYCLNTAAKSGLVDSCNTRGYTCQTIAPMLSRFDRCLESRSYRIEPCRNGGSECLPN